jgi:hypothetical protein
MLDARLREEAFPRRVRREVAKADAPDGDRRYATRQKVTGMRQVMGSVGTDRHLPRYP